MANETSEIAAGAPTLAGIAPGLVGVYGRLRIEIAGKAVGTMIVEGIHVGLIADTDGPADATVLCANDEAFRSLLKGELNPFIASMRGFARMKGDRNFGTRVALGLQVGSPFAGGQGKGT